MNYLLATNILIFANVQRKFVTACEHVKKRKVKKSWKCREIIFHTFFHFQNNKRMRLANILATGFYFVFAIRSVCFRKKRSIIWTKLFTKLKLTIRTIFSELKSNKCMLQQRRYQIKIRQTTADLYMWSISFYSFQIETLIGDKGQG